INVGRPPSNALEGNQHVARRIVVEIVKVPQIEIAISERLSEEAGVECLLAAETDAKQFNIGEFQEAPGGKRICRCFQAPEGGSRGGKRNLLLENDVHERGETRLTHP